jgi:probable HAF family extracellular repeat protein
MALVSTAFALAAALVGAEALAAPPVYKILVLHEDAGIRPFHAIDINNHGEVAATGRHTDTRESVGVRYLRGAVTELPASADPDIFDISEVGDILGWIFLEGKGYIWHAGDGTRERVTGNIQPFGINSAGQVCGTSWTGADRALLWDHGTLQDLGDLGGGFATATKINDAGHVTGESWVGHDSEIHAFLWRDGVMHDLGLLPGSGGWYSGGQAINALDHVVGQANDAGGNVMPFLHDGTVMRRLPKVNGSEEFEPRAINLHDEVVGTTPSFKAVLYRHGHTYELQGLLDASGAGWERLQTADGINDRGQIVGTGVYQGRGRAYLATPVKQP